ncbi:MAG: TetR/AcrR family transcriptional regulator [Shewanella sp.]
MKLTERKRAALIEAAKDELLQYGFRAANMTRVCEKAGTSKRTLYNHFESKELLFSAAISALIDGKMQPHSLRYCPEQCLAAQLRAYLQQKVVALYQLVGLSVVRMVVAELIREPQLAAKYFALVENTDGALQHWIEAAMADGRIRQGASELMVSVIINLFHGHFLWPQLMANVEPPTTATQEALINEMIRIFLCAYEQPQTRDDATAP